MVNNVKETIALSNFYLQSIKILLYDMYGYITSIWFIAEEHIVEIEIEQHNVHRIFM
jgi:hypothetical protein